MSTGRSAKYLAIVTVLTILYWPMVLFCDGEQAVEPVYEERIR